MLQIGFELDNFSINTKTESSENRKISVIPKEIKN